MGDKKIITLLRQTGNRPEAKKEARVPRASLKVGLYEEEMFQTLKSTEVAPLLSCSNT